MTGDQFLQNAGYCNYRVTDLALIADPAVFFIFPPHIFLIQFHSANKQARDPSLKRVVFCPFHRKLMLYLQIVDK